MENLTYPFDLPAPVFAQPQGQWRRRGASETMVALASTAPGSQGRIWPTKKSEQVFEDQEGYTAWHYWAQGPKPESDFQRLVSVLPKGLEKQCSQNGEHPIHRLLLKGADEAVELWIKQFGIQHLITAGGDNYWHMLAWNGGEGRIQRLGHHLKEDLLDIPDTRGLTAAMVAVHRGTIKDLDQWLLMGAHPDIQDRIGNTLLHHVARYGDADWFGRVLDLGADDRIKNDRGQTPKIVMEDRVKHGTWQDAQALRRHWEIAYFHKTQM